MKFILFPIRVNERIRNSAGSILACLVFLTGVSCYQGEDPGLTERVDELKAQLENKGRELEIKDRKIASLEQETARLRDEVEQAMDSPKMEEPVQPTPQIRSLEEVESAFGNEALAYRSKLAAGLTDHSLDGVTLYRVDGTAAEHAYRTRMKLRLIENASGREMEVTVPVTADILGRWNFPEPQEVARLAAEGPTSEVARQPAAATDQEPTVEAGSGQQETADAGGGTESADTAGGSEVAAGVGSTPQGLPVADSQPTVVVEWSDGTSSQPARGTGGAERPAETDRQPPQPPEEEPAEPAAPPSGNPAPPSGNPAPPSGNPAPPPPPQPSGPGPMPSDEDVLIEF